MKNKIVSLASKLEKEPEVNPINNPEAKEKEKEINFDKDSNYSLDDDENDEAHEILFNFENQARGYFNLKSFALQNQIICKNLKVMSHIPNTNLHRKDSEKINIKVCGERKNFKFEIENEKYSKEQKLRLYANGRTLF